MNLTFSYEKGNSFSLVRLDAILTLLYSLLGYTALDQLDTVQGRLNMDLSHLEKWGEAFLQVEESLDVPIRSSVTHLNPPPRA